MRKQRSYIILCGLLLLAGIGCKKPYEPPQIKVTNNFLAVDGSINTTPNSVTTITLSRARRLVDTILNIPELYAQVFIENNAGGRYALQEKGDGIYTSPPLTLNRAATYKLDITTANGSHYGSDLVPVVQTPPIDSLTWKQPDDVTISVNTHDPQNSTRYYRWEYEETWEYHSFYDAVLGLNNGFIFYSDSTTQTHTCWGNAVSTDIFLGSSVKLSEDVISNTPLVTIPQNSVKIKYRYSVLVKQYGLTKEGYAYWQILQKNTQQLGTLFDPQPAQLTGNIHCLNNPAEPVIGYVSAGAVQEKRLFIDHNELNNWQVSPIDHACSFKIIAADPVNYVHFNYSDTAYGPYYFVSGGSIAIAKRTCLDCTLEGGSTKKPVFW